MFLLYSQVYQYVTVVSVDFSMSCFIKGSFPLFFILLEKYSGNYIKLWVSSIFPHCCLKLPEEERWRGRCWSLLPGIQCQEVWEWLKATSLRGGSDLTWVNLSLPRGCSNPGTGFPERCSMLHATQCCRAIWATPLRTCFNFWWALKLLIVCPFQLKSYLLFYSSLLHSVLMH